MKYAVTVGRNSSFSLSNLAKSWAEKLGISFIERPAGESLEKILSDNCLVGLLVATREGFQIFSANDNQRFHPGMAELRVQELLRGGKDNFADALELVPGKRVLDCTLGLAADAIVAAHVVGDKGAVVGLEASLPIWFMTTLGLKNYQSDTKELNNAMQRITTKNCLAGEYLKKIAENSFDVVYFDPMFKHPISTSSSINPLRQLACYEQVTEANIIDALKIAPLVVIKERFISFFKSLGITEIKGGKYSKVKYGIRRR